MESCTLITTKCGSFAARCILSGDFFVDPHRAWWRSFRMHGANRQDEKLKRMEEERFSIMHRHALTFSGTVMPRRVWQFRTSTRTELLGESHSWSPLVLGQAQDPDACQAVRACNLSCAHQRTKDLACQLERPQRLWIRPSGKVPRHCPLEQVAWLQMDIGTKAAYAT
jgi:hypothetical protein